MEIERKFLITQLPAELKQYEAKRIEQAYLCTDPVVRVRRSNDRYMLTCKGAGLLSREEFELPLTEQAYRHLCAKADGRVICKVRYLIPYQDRLIELDVFQGGLGPSLRSSLKVKRRPAVLFPPNGSAARSPMIRLTAMLHSAGKNSMKKAALQGGLTFLYYCLNLSARWRDKTASDDAMFSL